jgi:F0F1-type ATP synthase assembly protein I
MDTQREIQMAVGIASARDTMQWVGTVWCGVATGAIINTIKTGAPGMIIAPVLGMGVGLFYQVKGRVEDAGWV